MTKPIVSQVKIRAFPFYVARWDGGMMECPALKILRERRKGDTTYRGNLRYFCVTEQDGVVFAQRIHPNGVAVSSTQATEASIGEECAQVLRELYLTGGPA